ncbi:MAG: ABC transporter permease subunit [Mesorhizobium sp.]|nr:MAG: ABC transporter permease subunit [Mesorhizobium sp.]
MSGGDAIPEFSKAKSGAKAGDGHEVSLTNLSAFASGPGIRSGAEVTAIIAVAVIIIGGIELALRLFNVPHYIMPGPSAIAYALYDEFPLIAPHLGYTLVELVSGFSIGAIIALARSYGASTLQIFWKIRAPMALPMILVGLMIGAIFGLLTAVGAEMVGGGFGLGNRLTTYSSMIQMPQFFAVVLILSTLGILIYVLFFLIGKKWASWEA